MPITPSSVTLEPNQTQQFNQTGIVSPVWTLEGPGTLNQSGVYVAPSMSGASLVRVHSSFWSYVNASYFTKNADDSLVKNTATPGYYAQAKSVGQLNIVGDFVEFTIARTNPYWTGLENDAGTYRVIISAFSGGEIREYHPSGDVVSSTIVFSLGDVAKLTVLPGGNVEVRRNGAVVYTTTRTFLNQNLRFVTDGDVPNGTVIKLPKIQAANYTEFQAAVTISPPLLTTKHGLEGYYQADTLGLANNANVESFTDLSGNARHLTAKTSDYPLYKTGNYIQFNGTTNSPLSHNTLLTNIVCGFMVAKYDDGQFPAAPDGFKGLLTDMTSLDIFVGNANTNEFFDFGWEVHEFRSDDKIYPDESAPAPMQNWRLLFFRFWRGVTMEGIQIGQQRNLTTRKWKGGIKFLALYSSNMCEADIRKNAKAIADHYGITLADVYPYQADKRGSPQRSVNRVSFYDPPEGDRISEVIDTVKRNYSLKFTSRRQVELDAMIDYHNQHYAYAIECIYRDYDFIPPKDIVGYINSEYELDGAVNNFDYGFDFVEK